MIQSILRAADILEVLKVPDKEFTVSDISREMQLPPSTVHRFLETLCEVRYVVKDDRAHTYRLGPALISLGIIPQHNLHLQNIAKPILDRLSHETNEDSFLIIKCEYKGLLLEQSQSSNPLKIVDKHGYERDLHCGAIRKALLAYQTDDFIKDYITQALTKDSAFPKITPQVLLESLEMIRKTGISLSYGDYIKDSIGIGAPVFNCNNNIVASIGIIFPNARLKGDDHLNKLKAIVKRYANELSVSIGASS